MRGSHQLPAIRGVDDPGHHEGVQPPLRLGFPGWRFPGAGTPSRGACWNPELLGVSQSRRLAPRPGGWAGTRGGRRAPEAGQCTWVPGAGRAGCGGGSWGVASTPPGRDLHVYVTAPDFLLLLRCRYARAGSAGGRRARQDVATSSPPALGHAAPPSAPVTASPPRPRRAPCFEVRTLPSPAPRSSPCFAPSPAAHPWLPPPPRLPEGRSHERDVQLSSHRRHRLLVRRGLRQWLHQHFGVSEPSSRGAQAGRGLGGPWC